MFVESSDHLVMSDLIHAEAPEEQSCENVARFHEAAKVLSFADRFAFYFGTISGHTN